MITRIRELLETRQLSPTQFADFIGVGRPVISHILSERNKPSLEVVQKIIGAFPDISLPWLLAGTGPMLAATPMPPPSPSTSATEAAEPSVLAVPPVAASAAPVPPVASPTYSAGTGHTTTVSQPGAYPQPPKFRPGAPASVATPSFAAEPAVGTSSPAPIADPVAMAPVLLGMALTPPTGTAPAGEPTSAASVQSPFLVSPSPATVAPAMFTENLGTSASLAAPAAETVAPSANSETDTPLHPAAALSFLGEPGKAIRRIVIFYRDGSFSDYLPGGN